MTDSITSAPIAQVRVSNSVGDSTFTTANGTFTLSTTTKVVYQNNSVQTTENKVIQIRTMRGEMIAQFSSTKPNLPLLANGAYIVTEKADNQAPFSYTILGLSNGGISNYFVRNNQANKYSSTLLKTRSITSANSLTFTKDGYQTVQKNITGSQSGLVVRMLPAAPDSAPSLISPTNAATNVATSPTLTWSTVSGSTAYRVQVSTVSSFATMINDDSTLTTGSKTVSGLANSTTYYWRANAKNAGGTSAWSTMYSFTTAPAVPATPTLMFPVNAATNVAVMPTLTWNTVTGANTYRIQIAAISDFSTITIDDSTLTSGTKTLTTTLSGAATYYWRVNAKNTGGTSGYSTAFSFTTVPAAPGSPTLTSPANAAAFVALVPTLTWGTVTGASTYHVQLSTASTFTTTIADDSTLTTGSKTVNGLANSTTYYWRANEKNAGGTSEWSTISSFTTVPAIPAIPTLLTPINAATDIAVMPTFTWNTVAGAATYRIQIATASDFSLITADDSTLTAGTKTLITALSGTLTYYWRVNAKNAGGTSAWSTMRSFTTALTDADGNVYHTVTIGTQTWTVENLKTTKYNDGTVIPLVTDNTAWSNLTTGACCWYNNDSATYKSTYGALYNWYAVNTGKLAPAGWHVPTDAEWGILSTFLGGDAVSGGKLKESGTTHWPSPNTGATNETGFSALPGGYRYYDDAFYDVGGNGYWWSATENNASYAYNRYLFYNLSFLVRDYYNKSSGLSVRLVRDSN